MTDPDSRAELPPCPFCGEHDGVIVVKNDPGYPHFATLYLVHCNQCAVQTTRFTSRAEAIAAWSRRTVPQGYAAGIEVCTGCGSTESIEEIRARKPGALSCCPERQMIKPAEVVRRLRGHVEAAYAMRAPISGKPITAWQQCGADMGTAATLIERLAALAALRTIGETEER